jgi:hypothetical protein
MGKFEDKSKRKEIYSVFSQEADMTFIMEDVWDGDDVISTEVKGFYYGMPNEEFNKSFYNDLKAEYK